MSKLVYKVENGSPTIIDEDKQYDFEYTETAPPEGIYSPFFFDGVEWIGTTKEDYENNNPTDPYEPTHGEIMLAQAQMQVTKTANQLIKTQQEQANTLTELTKKEQRLKEIEQQQANTLLEIAKLKGEK